MAKLRMGPIASDIRNSIGGTTFSRNRGGSYARGRVTPLNPRSSRQTVVRAAFGSNAKAWSGLLDAAQRQAWTFFAQANPAVDVFGASIVLSGIAMYQRLNQVLSNVPAPNISNAPSDLSVPALATVTSLASDSAGQTVAFQTDVQAVTAGVKYYLSATRPLPPGRSPQKSDFRYLKSVAATAAGNDLDITAEYLAAFGPILPGQVIGGLAATVNTASGALTPGLAFDSVVQ